jgi:hypothetical protein
MRGSAEHVLTERLYAVDLRAADMQAVGIDATCMHAVMHEV